LSRQLKSCNVETISSAFESRYSWLAGCLKGHYAKTIDCARLFSKILRFNSLLTALGIAAVGEPGAGRAKRLRQRG
jgi:hypothetical protein